MNMADVDLAALTHTVHAIGRTGARSFEVGFLDDDPPHRWWAAATFRDTRVTCDNQDEPLQAVLGLYAIIAAGGTCTTCGRTVALDHADVGLVDGARMHDEVFQARVTDVPCERLCVRRLHPDGWTGCERTSRRAAS